MDSNKIADGSVTSGDLADGAVIAEIQDDDGPGSGLNADLLDDHDSTHFSVNGHLHDSRYVNQSGDTISGSLTLEGSLRMGTDAGNDNDYIYMDAENEYFRWEEDLDDDPGNGAEGGFYLSDEIEVVGDVTLIGSLSDFKYKTPKTRYLNIPACAFVKNDFYINTVWAASLGFNYTSNRGTDDYCSADAPVYLPAGAEITGVEVRYYDNHAGEDVSIEFWLKWVHGTIPSDYTMATGSTLSDGQNTRILSVEDNDGVIDHNPISGGRSYYLTIEWDPTKTTFSSNLRFYGASIIYTVDRVGN